MKNALNEAKSNGFAFPGLYLKITLKNIDINILSSHPKNKPLVIYKSYFYSTFINKLLFLVCVYIFF